MKVIITGSRNWTGEAATSTLTTTLDTLQAFATAIGERLTIVHGDCPTGADHLADRWARRRADTVDLITYPAQWAVYHLAAGPIRNKVMVEAGADMMIGFVRNSSRGATGCLALAKAQGIVTKTVHWDPAWSPLR